jgi:hypothetical protein
MAPMFRVKLFARKAQVSKILARGHSTVCCARRSRQTTTSAASGTSRHFAATQNSVAFRANRKLTSPSPSELW